MDHNNWNPYLTDVWTFKQVQQWQLTNTTPFYDGKLWELVATRIPGGVYRVSFKERIDNTKIQDLETKINKWMVELNQCADKLAEVSEWCEIPEETMGGINGVIDQMNDLHVKMQKRE